MAKKAAKRARLANLAQVIDDDAHYYEMGRYVDLVTWQEVDGVRKPFTVQIPWSLLVASVRRYNAVQRQKCQAKRASK